MKKVFVSVPMRGRAYDHIEDSIISLHQFAEITFGEKLQCVSNLEDDDPPMDVELDGKGGVWHLGHAISKMAECDYFVGVYDYQEYPGCHIEARVASLYDIPMRVVNVKNFACFNDIAYDGLTPMIQPKVNKKKDGHSGRYQWGNE